MNDYCKKVLNEMENEITELTLEVDNSLVLCETAIELILSKIATIKEFVLKRGFANETEEINFFKRLKPSIISKLIYYNTIYKIETKRPYGRHKNIKKYLNNELSKIKRYFDNNLEFYKYYRTNST